MITAEGVLDRVTSHLSDALRSGVVRLARGGHDGREDSQQSEQHITQTLALQFMSDQYFAEHGLRFAPAQSRYWYDFLVTGENDLWLPVNVKISSFSGSDNLSSKEGLFYALTGVDPKNVPHPDGSGRKMGINSWEPYFVAMAHYFGHDKSADYYFLVVDKNDPGHVFWTSLRQMAALDPNGNNLPYQAHWGRNRERIQRSWEESAQFLMGVFRDALELRARILDQFDESIGRRL